MTHKTQVNIRIPNIESLYCINCKINEVDIQDPIVKSLFHSQILTCRLIIYTMRCCIASPSIQNVDDLIHIVVNKSFYDSGKFQEHLSKLQIYYTDPEPVHPKIYEACLKYTFTFRLAPHWNSIGKSYYLQGFNFLSLTSNINAIEWNILIKNSNDIKLELIPIKMNLFPLTLDSLSLPSKTVDGFTLNANINTIDLTSFENCWAYVLPKLTKARIVSVSKILPESCLFRNYNDLRRHWKNMYSYRLPKNEQGLLFYEVVFPSQPTKYFIYPETCILSRMPQILMSDNKNEIASQFLKDLSTNVHSVCGEVMQVYQLYPELDIEYSCVLKKRSQLNENQYSQFQRSSFVKTPTELPMNLQSINEKLNLSSLFAFKDMNRMKSDLQHHSQKVLSIMQNNKRKRKAAKQDANEHLTQSMFNFKKRKYGINQKFMPSISKEEHEKTVVSNIDDIISFYDIPSMYSKNKELEQSNQDPSFKQIIDNCKSADPIPQSFRPKPVIKNIQNLCYSVNDTDLPINFDELEINKNKTDITKNNVLGEDCYNIACSTPKSLNLEEENDLPENLVSDQHKKEIHKSPSFKNKRDSKSQTTKHSRNLNDKILSELLSKETNKKTIDSMETQSYDQKIRLFLSSFDLANIQKHDEINLKKQFNEDYKRSPPLLNENNKSSNENLMENTAKVLVEKSEFSENHRCNSKFDTSYDKLSGKLPFFTYLKNKRDY
ncbi:uncharacterized protein LOC131664093 [Phymastichus coffea]|uniref:uncharacterized protein LOC131664093 n=1 Tax=Phymastichus coffea TaxID=108790 RepID=UPI00273B077D|nr:uncharacterized protein LOC131664093 [Phymastichus coffea]